MKKGSSKPFFLLLFLLFTANAAFAYKWRIMPLGNSITVGVHGSDPVGGYRDDLQILLQNGGYEYNFVGTRRDGDPAVFDVDHQGTGGIRADQVIPEIDAWLNSNPPDIVLLHIGTNDISNGDDVNSTVDEIGQILDHIYNFDPEITTLLSSLIPRNDSRNCFSAELNHGIVELVATKQDDGYLVEYVPINEAFVADENWRSDYMDDTVHPNNTGYHVMAEEWYDALIPVFDGTINPPPSIGTPATIEMVSGDSQNGVVFEILSEPLIVKVLDENQSPVFDTPVHFEVRSGNGAAQPDGFGKTQFIEAESGEIQSPCKIVSDYQASDDAYVVSGVNKSGSFILTVTVTEEADYWLWGRVFAPSIVEDSFYMTVDDSPDTILWDIDRHENWYWHQVSDRSLGRMSYHLIAGKHRIQFITREENTRLDKMVLTDDPDFIPRGVSGFPDVYTDQNGEARVYWLLGNETGIQEMKATCPDLADQSVLFQADAYSDPNQTVRIAGKIAYYVDEQPVSAIQLMLNHTQADTTDGCGAFEFNNLPIGEDYLIQPDSTAIAGNAENTIISYDAALVSRYVVGMEELTPHQILAADADGDGGIFSYDASLIARFAVGLAPMSGSRVGAWLFDPKDTKYTHLDSSVTDLIFTGMVCGDVHGGWTPDSAAQKRAIATTDLLTENYSWQQDTLVFAIPLQSNELLLSFDLEMDHNPGEFDFLTADFSDLDPDFSVFSKIEKGSVRIGGFSITGCNEEKVLILKYKVRNAVSQQQITMHLLRINNHNPVKSVFNIENDLLPKQFTIYPNYPNPFSRMTTFSFRLTKPERVTLRLFNTLGQEVWEKSRHYDTAGMKSELFHSNDRYGRPLVSGTYFLHLQLGSRKSFIQKLSIIR